MLKITLFEGEKAETYAKVVTKALFKELATPKTWDVTFPLAKA